MILDLNGQISTSVHKICISDSNRKRFVTIYPKLSWTDNISFARTFESEQEALDFETLPAIRDFLENELNLLIWTDTKKSIL
jgi:hypothetical protein